MPYFPMFLNLREQPVIVVGGGSVARRKVLKLLPFGPRIRIISPRIASELTALPAVETVCRAFCPEDLCPRPAMVVAATDDREVNHLVSRLCREQHIPVNVVDDPDACTFVFPALVQQGGFCAGISTGGASPTAAIYFKERIQGMLPDHLEDLLSWLEEQRRELKQTVPEQTKRAGIFRRMFDACLELGRPLTQQERENCLNGFSEGSVAIVDAGNGRASELSVEGLRLVQQCQALVYDPAIDLALLESAPEAAQRLPLEDSPQAWPQQTAQMLMELAQSGLRTVWLERGGVPSDRALVRDSLCTAGISCRIVPEDGSGQKTGGILSGVRVGAAGDAKTVEMLRIALEKMGAETCRLPLPAQKKDREEAPESLPHMDYIFFSDAGAAEQFFHSYGTLGVETRCVCAGLDAAKALRVHTDRPVIPADENSISAIVKAIVRDAI